MDKPNTGFREGMFVFFVGFAASVGSLTPLEGEGKGRDIVVTCNIFFHDCP